MDETRTQAEQLLQRQSLRELSAAVTDPILRAQAAQLADGRMSAAEFVRHMEQSPTAMRGLDRFVKHVVTLTPRQWDAIRAGRERHIDRITAELLAPPDHPAPAEEDEPQSWLE